MGVPSAGSIKHVVVKTLWSLGLVLKWISSLKKVIHLLKSDLQHKVQNKLQSEEAERAYQEANCEEILRG